MANFQLTQTGAQVQADLNKVESIAEIKTVGSGLTLSSSGELSSSGGSVIFGKVYLQANDTTYFTIQYIDGTTDNNWETISLHNMYSIQPTKPFKILYDINDIILNPAVRYNDQYGEFIPFQVSNSVICLDGTGERGPCKLESLLVYTLINADLHIYYTDNGVD